MTHLALDAAEGPRPLVIPVLEPQVDDRLESSGHHPRPALRGGLTASVERNLGRLRATQRVGAVERSISFGEGIGEGVYGEVEVYGLEVGYGGGVGGVVRAHLRVAHVQGRGPQRLEPVPDAHGARTRAVLLQREPQLPQRRAQASELLATQRHVELARGLRCVRGDHHLGHRGRHVAVALLDAERRHVHDALLVHPVPERLLHRRLEPVRELGQRLAGELLQGEARRGLGVTVLLLVCVRNVPRDALGVERGARDVPRPPMPAARGRERPAEPARGGRADHATAGARVTAGGTTVDAVRPADGPRRHDARAGTHRRSLEPPNLKEPGENEFLTEGSFRLRRCVASHETRESPLFRSRARKPRYILHRVVHGDVTPRR